MESDVRVKDRRDQQNGAGENAFACTETELAAVDSQKTAVSATHMFSITSANMFCFETRTLHLAVL